jgi:penicillin amidase
VPTFNLVIADVDGQIAVQSTGRIPMRSSPERGYRPGWDPQHQWIGLLPFEAMPQAIDPPRGWLASANNRLAGNDYPYPLYGCWVSGYRAQRIREMIEAGLPAGFTRDDFSRMHCDTLSLRAVACLPTLLAALSSNADSRVQEAASYLQAWDGRVEPDLVAPTLFNVFHTFWSKAVARVHFEGPALELIARLAEGFAGRLLVDDPHGWFPAGQRQATLERAFAQTLDELTLRFGPDMSQWRWGRLHRLPLKHVLSGRGDLGQLLDHGNSEVGGDMITVSNTGSGPQWLATSGAGCRLVADLATHGLWAIDAQSQSGLPATPHYSDQYPAWSAGQYQFLPLDRDAVAKIICERLVLSPVDHSENR